MYVSDVGVHALACVCRRVHVCHVHHLSGFCILHSDFPRDWHEKCEGNELQIQNNIRENFSVSSACVCMHACVCVHACVGVSLCACASSFP